jgi:hypothetical protein
MMTETLDGLDLSDSSPFAHPRWCIRHPGNQLRPRSTSPASDREDDETHRADVYTVDALDQDDVAVSVQMIQRFEAWPIDDPDSVHDHQLGIQIVVHHRETFGDAEVSYSIPEAWRLHEVLGRVLRAADHRD